MIEVIIRHKESGAEFARVEIECVEESDGGEYASYAVRLGVERIGAVGVYTRALVNFPRRKYNVLALLKQALETLEPEDLELDGPYEKRTYRSARLSLLRGLM